MATLTGITVQLFVTPDSSTPTTVTIPWSAGPLPVSVDIVKNPPVSANSLNYSVAANSQYIPLMVP